MRMNLYKCFSLLFTSGVFFSGGLHAQKNDSTYWRDFETVGKYSPWLLSENPSGLDRLSVTSISDMSVFFNKSNGKFINYYQADNSRNYGISTRSYYRLNPQTVFQGEMSYSNFQGKNMQGSAFLDPYQNPLDIDDYTDSTSGTKKIEYYHLLGAVSVQFSPKWTVGGKIKYDAGNYTKIKDMRHANNISDLDAKVGTKYASGQNDDWGVAFGYGRRVESVLFSVVGNKDRQYTSLINYGNFYGDAELFSDNGYTSDQNPAVNTVRRFTVSYGHSFSNKNYWLNEITLGRRTGYFGKKGTTNIAYTEHHADQYALNSIFTLRNKSSFQNIILVAGYSDLKNNENVYRKETQTSGNSVIAYYGSNEVFHQKLSSVSLKQEGFWKLTELLQPIWKTSIEGDFFRREQTTVLYPNYRLQTVNSYSVKINGERNWIQRHQMYTLGSLVQYGGGFGTAKTDGIYDLSSSNQLRSSRDKYLYEEYEYFTKPRVNIGLRVGYSYDLLNRNILSCFVDYNYTKAFNVQYVGKDIHYLSLHLTYTF